MKESKLKNAFRRAPILLPDLEDLSSFSVVACDQYSSQPEYWDEVEEQVGEKPSALHFVLPEAWLNTEKGKQHQAAISAKMKEAIDQAFFREYPDSYIYVERSMNDGSIRQGLIGMVDLETYDYHPGAHSAIRATEATIIERIPPRVAIRKQAPIEFPHILLLADDKEDVLLSHFRVLAHEGSLPLLYDFDLMQSGGHITGWLADGQAADQFDEILNAYSGSVSERYPGLSEDSLVFVVGDGNHSLATAKTIWDEISSGLNEEEKENHPARFALAELENIHHVAQKFEPIHRIVTGIDPEELLRSLYTTIGCVLVSPFFVTFTHQGEEEKIYLDPSKGELSCQIIQNFLDAYLKEHGGSIDYIHGDAEVRQLAMKADSAGLVLPAIDKSSLFRGVITDGSLPRKTFSMGHANEKRFYLEGKVIADLG